MSILSSFISHQIWLQRNASHEVNELAPFIQQMRDEVRANVLAFGDDNRTRQNLEKLLKDLEDILDGITGNWEEKLTEDLQDLAVYETDWTVKTLEINVDTNFTTPTPEQVWSAIKFNPLALDHKPVDFQQMISGWSEVEVNRLVMGVKTGFVQGMTTRDIVKTVVGPGGLADISQRHAATVVRTALNHVSTEAKDLVYKKNSDIVEGYELVVTLDSRTSTICRGWPPGKVYKPSDKFQPKPPFHPACRTTTAPVVSSEFDFLDEGAKRAARGADGGMQVDANTSYYDFLKQQPAWFQDKALGPTRGKIFRNAGMSPEEFRAASVDGFGHPLTLKEMAEADKRVAEYLKED
jgi:phage putative head morphogenesis protein, SPP1 gp7 family